MHVFLSESVLTRPSEGHRFISSFNHVLRWLQVKVVHMGKSVEVFISLLLISGCSNGEMADLSLKTKINNYTVPDEMVEIYTAPAESLLEEMKSELEDNDENLEILLATANSGRSLPIDFAAKIGLSLAKLKEASEDLKEAISFVEDSSYAGAFGRLKFTYIKTNLNGIKSFKEKWLFCSKQPEESVRGKSLHMKYLYARWKIDDYRSSDLESFAERGARWNESREHKDLKKLSKLLCQRYFNFDRGGFYIEGQIPQVYSK